mgnify:CR=1 FL=1
MDRKEQLKVLARIKRTVTYRMNSGNPKARLPADALQKVEARIFELEEDERQEMQARDNKLRLAKFQRQVQQAKERVVGKGRA